MTENNIYSLAKLLGASNISHNPFVNNPLGQRYLTQRERAQSAEQALQATTTSLGALSSGIALYMQRKRENKALDEISQQLKERDAKKEERRQALLSALPENDRLVAGFLQDDKDLAAYAAKALAPENSKEQLDLEGKRLRNAKLEKDLAKQPLTTPSAVSNQGPSKALPAPALKLQSESLDKIGVAESTRADLGEIKRQIDSGELELGPIKNIYSSARNYAGKSSPESINFANFKSSLEKLRNDSLRLNNGVQTEGDAKRAWNELFTNINDRALVSKRLEQIQKINDRAASLQKAQVNQIRKDYGASPLNFEPFEKVPTALGNGKPVNDPLKLF